MGSKVVSQESKKDKRKKKKHPKVHIYEKWTPVEDERLLYGAKITKGMWKEVAKFVHWTSDCMPSCVIALTEALTQPPIPAKWVPNKLGGS